MSEPGRRVVHASGSLIPLLFVLEVLTWSQVRYVLLGGTIVAFVLEALRLRGRLDLTIYRRLTREYEREQIAGYALAALGTTIAAWAFEPLVAVPAMFMLTLADPVSGILSRDALGIKQGYVLLATFAVCLAIASVLLVPIWPAVAGAGAATLADGVKPTIAGKVIDDNLSIPVAAGAAMHVALLL